jgi:hypothetical protein
MNWRKFWHGVGVLLLALIPTVVAPWVDAEMKGIPLNGMPGIARFWLAAARRSFSFELWQVILFVTAVTAVASALSIRMVKSRRSKPGLSIVILNSPAPSWSIGANGQMPVMFVHFYAQLAHTGPHALRLVKVYLKGTDSVVSFPPIVVTGPYDDAAQIHTGVRPILVNGRRAFTRHAIFVDQFGNRYRTDPICFQPSANPIPHALTAMRCHFCGEPVAMEELAESAALYAHKGCVR